MNYHIHDLMKEDFQAVASANHVLTRLWRFLLHQLQISPSSWDTLLAMYIAKAKTIKGVKEANNLKGNLPKRLACDELTFKNLCRGLSVFAFPKIVMRLELRKGDVKKDIEILIPPTFDDEGGRYLKVLWNQMTKEFPHCVNDWNNHAKAYAEYCKKIEGLEVDNVSNLPRALDAELLTWNSFYKGVLIHAFDEITICLDLYKRSSVNEAHSIRLVVLESES